MVPCISRTVMRDTDRLIFTVTFEGDLIDSCEAFISLENVDIIEPRVLSCKKLGAKLNKFSYEFSSEDIRLGFKHGIRWKFKDSVLP